ncbi:inositol 2-dehydrogenase [Paenibacillus validus]|uniref:Inositol 2-dehydrogenase n=1 Tax=Paenibacillus validus TaxID=44253 RepID=A0A7X3CSK9_9BACL|nr:MULTISPECIES: inositol 2-dehydrogenase [Paenibacillus]MED4599299.1 inositol 2-dehydrogenase [Paenibacillus validus]MED4606389.1 inositol 2-dehydrogenase [Paenibacillus validus]MUG70089.1 inositol 2-dehydrogenase [Paenibacillus validus]
MKQIRCAVLGLGRLGYWHAENLATKIRGARLLTVIDPIAGRAEQVASELGIESYSIDPDDAFNNPDIDAVVIVTPTSTHAEMIKKAAAKGKQIFVEKPITQTLAEADEVIEAIRKNNVVCQVGFMRRFDPAYHEAKKRIAKGDIGQPIYFKGLSRDGNVPPASFIKHSGGIYLDISIHDYDIARYLMNADVVSVQATGHVLMHAFLSEYGDVDQALTTLQFSNGAAGDIETMRIAPYGYDIRGEIVGTEGVITIGSLREHNIQILNHQGSTYDIIPDFPSKFKDAYLLEMAHFIESLMNGTKPDCTEEDGKAALAIAIAATDSFKSGKLVQIQTVNA